MAKQDPDCLFCKIVSGQMQATVVRETDRTLSFRDVNPQAPTHVLVVPKDHYPDAYALATGDGSLAAELFEQAHEVAAADGISDSGYRLVFNKGPDASQTVFHVHCHVLGGRAMTWPPG